MDSLLLLLVLLALPLAAAGVILTVSFARRRARHRPVEDEPAHRFQAGTAADQDGAVTAVPPAPKASARLRRAASAGHDDR